MPHHKLIKSAVLLGGVSMTALAGGCSAVVPSPPTAYNNYNPPRAYYHPPPHQYADPPIANDDPLRQVADAAAPVSRPAKPPHNLGDMAMGAGVGVAGSMAANQLLSSGARSGAADLAGEAAVGAVTGEAAGEAAAGAATAGEIGEAAGVATEMLEGDAIIDGILEGLLALLAIRYDEPLPPPVTKATAL